MANLNEIKKHVSYERKYGKKLWNVKFINMSKEDFQAKFPEITIKETIQEYSDNGYRNPDRKIISLFLS